MFSTAGFLACADQWRSCTCSSVISLLMAYQQMPAGLKADKPGAGYAFCGVVSAVRGGCIFFEAEARP
jgi:hypothetical protein